MEGVSACRHCGQPIIAEYPSSDWWFHDGWDSARFGALDHIAEPDSKEATR